MAQAPLAETLTALFDDLPQQLQAGARWVLDHPADVALLSMRDQARRAGVPPVTLTRLAKRLGFAGFDEMKALYAQSMRGRPDNFRDRAEELVARRGIEGDAGLVADTIRAQTAHLQALAAPEAVAVLTSAADRIVAADRVFCLGLRSAFPAAYMFHYVHALFGATSVLLDGAGGAGGDQLKGIGPRDVLLVVSVNPYARATVDAARYAAGRAAAVVAVTDSGMSPVARLAADSIIVATDTPSFFHTMAPAFVAVEMLAAMVAARRGPEALAALTAAEDYLAAFDTYLLPPKR
ncbi:MAG: MurR/RpiR family transcriptional regulator [Ferrovibrionaceae bacterium]